MKTNISTDKLHQMHMRYPAARWMDALPLGNGSVAALMYGLIEGETIVFNHDKLFYPLGSAPHLDMSAELPKVRELLKAGKTMEAEKHCSNLYAERRGIGEDRSHYFVDPYVPLCALRLQNETNGPFRAYRRGLEYDTGRGWLRWDDDGGQKMREAYTSASSGHFLLRLRADYPKAIGFKLHFENFSDPHTEPHPWWFGYRDAKPETENTRIEQDALIYTATYHDGTCYGAVAHVEQEGGKLREDEGKLSLEEADEAVIRVALFVDKGGVNQSDALLKELREAKPFDEEVEAHKAIHQEQFERIGFSLGSSQERSNEELLLDAYEGTISDELLCRLFEQGRYLFIASSAAGCMPPNLQGKWNGSVAPAWGADIHNDENVQMTYWQALPGNLPERVPPLFDFYESLIEDYRTNAKNHYGARGILLPIAQTTHGFAYPDTWVAWTTGNGWIAQHFYDYFLYTNDKDFLRERAIPWLIETVTFFEDFLVEEEDGKLHFIPSLSPENSPTGGTGGLLSIDATMEVAIVRESLSNLIEGCEILGIHTEDCERWKQMLSKLPDYAINEDGALSEWVHPDFGDNYEHRHLSHLYPLFPGFEITEEDDPRLYKACQIAVEKRLTDGLTSQAGWSLAHMASIFARLGLGDKALECVEILSRSCLGTNLFTWCNDWREMGMSLTWASNPPFQADANYGITAAVIEMCLFSKPGLTKLLPALPTAWKEGSIDGLITRDGAVISMQWNQPEKRLQATIRAQRSLETLVKQPPYLDTLTVEPTAKAERIERDTGIYWKLSLDAGEGVELKC